MTHSMSGKGGPHVLSLQYTVIEEAVVREAVDLERELEGKSRAEGSGGRGTTAQEARGGSGAGSKPVSLEPIRLEEVASLRLSYKNILGIDNLVGLRALTTLCLDNNVIEEIGNLGHLVNLEWLDLSFNNIRKIGGLDKLVRLKDLSLYSNQIEVVENLERCAALECLSLGRNKINRLDNLLYLRQFRKLQLLTLEGNPVCKDPEYRPFVLAQLESLRYLDYGLVDKSEVVSAREQYQDELLEAEERESLEEANHKAAAAHKEYLSRLAQAGLTIVDTLYGDMFSEDKELPKLKLLPGFEAIYDAYQHEFRALSEQTINAGLAIFQRFASEKSRLDAAILKVTTHNEQQSIAMVEAFAGKKKRLGQAIAAFVRAKRDESVLRATSEADEAALAGRSQEGFLHELGELEDDAAALREELMGIEQTQTQQLKKLSDTFEGRGGAIRTERVEHCTAFFRGVEDLENSFATALEELAVSLLDKMANNLLEDLDDDTVAFLSDRDNLMVAIQGAHDVHLGKLLAQEDAVRDGVNKELSNMLRDLKKDFAQRNRDRIFELNRMTRETNEQVELLVNDVRSMEDEEAA